MLWRSRSLIPTASASLSSGHSGWQVAVLFGLGYQGCEWGAFSLVCLQLGLVLFDTHPNHLRSYKDMLKRLALLLYVFFFGVLPFASAQSVELAKDYYQHSLNDKAKDVLITVLHGATTTPANKAKCLYLLGQISFEEGHIRVALTDWQTLVKDYPQ